MRCGKTLRVCSKVGFVLVIVQVFLAIVDPLWLSAVGDATESQTDNIRLVEGQDESGGPFEAMLLRHNSFEAEFTRWRNLFARHASALAQLVKTFPNGRDLDARLLYRIFTNASEYQRHIAGEIVFAPWTNRWSGTWSNGVPQYHVWGPVYHRGGQWIQHVSLSEHGFADLRQAREELRNGRTDIAINVFSDRLGITGWVSKWQNERVEMPHVGYWIDATTLIWLCQIKKPEALLTRDNRWFVFVETVDRAADPEKYEIYGVQVVVDDTVSVLSEQDKHFGTYNSNGSISASEEG